MGREPTIEEEEIEVQLEGDKQKEEMEGQDKVTFKSFLNAFNDLVKGQKEVLTTINKLSDKSGSNQNLMNNDGKGGSNSGKEMHSRTTMKSHPHIYNGSTRPTLPQFLNNTTVGLDL